MRKMVILLLLCLPFLVAADKESSLVISSDGEYSKLDAKPGDILEIVMRFSYNGTARYYVSDIVSNGEDFGVKDFEEPMTGRSLWVAGNVGSKDFTGEVAERYVITIPDMIGDGEYSFAFVFESESERVTYPIMLRIGEYQAPTLTVDSIDISKNYINLGLRNNSNFNYGGNISYKIIIDGTTKSNGELKLGTIWEHTGYLAKIGLPKSSGEVYHLNLDMNGSTLSYQLDMPEESRGGVSTTTKWAIYMVIAFSLVVISGSFFMWYRYGRKLKNVKFGKEL